MSDRQGPPSNKKNWEHSRYKDWRPAHHEEDAPKRGFFSGGSGDEPKRRGSFLGFLLKAVVWIALLLLIFGPGADFVNGLAKAPEEGCTLRVVVDGGTIVSSCSQLPEKIAGFEAPALFEPGCVDEAVAAGMASLELRKILYGADLIEVLGPGAAIGPAPEPVPVPDSEPAEDTAEATDGATEAADAEATETPDAEPAETPAPAQRAVVPDGSVVVLIDGTNLADLMLATETVQLPGGPGWCAAE
ncbi:hypothetical protein [Pseudoruegeria sp. HB172150]|uniref:hypothetical protein n=1 Tax=Pseudoruegeria sp. HB172150 TaxID=2721164 RepID=UPI001552EEBB|nr:hypothetical protein [Pseudoruegeria sp. HB172150]